VPSKQGGNAARKPLWRLATGAAQKAPECWAFDPAPVIDRNDVTSERDLSRTEAREADEV